MTVATGAATLSTFGLNTSFAIKRWPEPERWAALTRQIGVDLVQFSFDLLDPWWPATLGGRQAARIRSACTAEGLTLDSAFLGLAAYSYNGLLHPDRDVRDVTEDWWRRAIDLAAQMGAGAMGGPLGATSVAGRAVPGLREETTERMHRLAEHARSCGLQALLIELTPLRREWPHTPDELRELLWLTAQTAVPWRVVLDLGHTLVVVH